MKCDGVKLRNDIASLAADKGAKAFGVADLRLLEKKVSARPHLDTSAYNVAVVLGVRLQGGALADIKDCPTPIYFHNYRQVNYQLDGIALEVADMIQDAGFLAVAIAASQVVEKEPMTGHISHRLLGWAAGIGHIGRNNLLVHPEFGAAMRYVSVLTDAPIPADVPWSWGECGNCHECEHVCPVGAIHGSREAFDLRACRAKLEEFTRISFIGQHICGVCVKACRGSHGSRNRE